MQMNLDQVKSKYFQLIAKVLVLYSVSNGASQNWLNS